MISAYSDTISTESLSIASETIFMPVSSRTRARSFKLAEDAVRQWKYKPAVIGGKPVGIIFTVTCRFKLKDVGTEEFDERAVIAGDEEVIKPPQLLKKVKPIYPEEARKARIQGVVVLRVWVNEEGIVEKTMVMKSENSMLSKPAIDAVKQWKYEVLQLEGKPTPVVFNVTVAFKLK